MGYAGIYYGITAAALSLFFVYTAVRVMRDDTTKSAKLMYGYSVFYLFAIFLAVMADAR